jgi:multidrug efflux pump
VSTRRPTLRFRDEVGDIDRLHQGAQCARRHGADLGSVVEVTQSYGPDPVIRYNGYPAADLSAAGINPALLSSHQAIER